MSVDVSNAEYYLEFCKRELNDLASANDKFAAHRAFENFATSFYSFFGELGRQTKGTKHQSYWTKTQASLKKNPTLRYLQQYRNAHHVGHTRRHLTPTNISNIIKIDTESSVTGIMMDGCTGLDGEPLDFLGDWDGENQEMKFSRGNPKVHRDKTSVNLGPIVNFGVSYELPMKHLKPSERPAAICEVGMKWMEEKFALLKELP